MPTSRPIITLLTDFGSGDTYAAQMKGVIAGIVPEATVIDLTHQVPPHDILTGGLMLDGAVDAVPDGAIHIAVVDPGVGSDRAAIAVQTRRFSLVGPDNGLFTAVLEREPQYAAVQLTNRRYHRQTTSATFHGRDIFAAAAAHLATGLPMAELGPPAERLVRLELPKVRVSPGQIDATVLLTDRFGNLITNLTINLFEAWRAEGGGATRIEVGGHTIHRVSRTYADGAPGELVAYFGSSGRLEIAVRNGSAKARIGDSDQTPVRISLSA